MEVRIVSDAKETGERLVLLRSLLRKKSQGELAGDLGVHPNTLGRYERGERLPDGDLLSALAALGVNTHWVLTGQGEAFLLPASISAQQEMVDAAAGDPAALRAREARHTGFSAGVDFERAQFLERYAMIPLLDVKAKAGAGYENPAPQVVGHRAFERAWLQQEGLNEKYLKLVVSDGYSMSPTIGHRWIVMLDESRKSLVPDGIFVLWTPPPGGTIIKRVDIDAITGDITLVSDNSEHSKPRLVKRDELDQLDVAGRAVWWAPGRAFV